MSAKIKAALAAAIILWASAYVAIRAGLQEYSPEGMALLRYLIASFIMVFVYYRQPVHSQINLADKIKLLLIGAFGIGVYSVTLNYGEVAISSGVASFIISQSPVLSTMLAIIFFGEKLTLKRGLGFVVSMIGVTLIAYGEIGSFTLTKSLLYLATALLACGTYSILHKPFLKKYNAVDATAYVIWGGTLFLTTYITKMQHDVMSASLSSTLIIVYLGIFPAALAYFAWSYALQNMSVSQTVSYMYVIPFVSAFMGWLWLNEVPTVISFMGAVVAITGVWLVNQSYQIEVDVEPDIEPEPEVTRSVIPT
jgi:drug/metabolite transporter (DMT)-like permease